MTCRVKNTGGPDPALPGRPGGWATSAGPPPDRQLHDWRQRGQARVHGCLGVSEPATETPRQRPKQLCAPSALLTCTGSRRTGDQRSTQLPLQADKTQANEGHKDLLLPSTGPARRHGGHKRGPVRPRTSPSHVQSHTRKASAHQRALGSSRSQITTRNSGSSLQRVTPVLVSCGSPRALSRGQPHQR